MESVFKMSGYGSNPWRHKNVYPLKEVLMKSAILKLRTLLLKTVEKKFTKREKTFVIC